MDRDEEKFSRLFDEHLHAVTQYAVRRSDMDTAQDVASETFLIAWRRLSDIPADARPWLLVVARNVLSNHQRGRRRRSLVEVAAARAESNTTQVATDDAVADRLVLRAALDLLNESDRELLMLVAWDGLSTAQAAQLLDCTAATARVRLHRARRKLLAAVEPSNAKLAMPSIPAQRVRQAPPPPPPVGFEVVTVQPEGGS